MRVSSTHRKIVEPAAMVSMVAQFAMVSMVARVAWLRGSSSLRLSASLMIYSGDGADGGGCDAVWGN